MFPWVGLQQLNLPVLSRPPAELSPSLSAQPPLMGNVDPSKIDEIRRTVYVGNLNSQVWHLHTMSRSLRDFALVVKVN